MIRLYNQNDLKKINELGKLLDSNYDKLFNNYDNNDHIYVYELDNEIIGFIHIKKIYDIEIINIVVDNNKRRMNIGNSLIEYVINNYNVNITLEVAVDNIAAINLYKKNNFKILSTRKNYYNGKDAYLMGRIINE